MTARGWSIGWGLALLLAALGAQAMPWESKIAPSVLRQRSQTLDMLVILEVQADLRAATTLRTAVDRRTAMVTALQAQAAATQAPLIAWLQAQGAEVQPFWIVNMLRVKGSADLLTALAQRADVRRIEPNPSSPFPAPYDSGPVAGDTTAIQPNLTVIRAPDVWALGYTGQNAVIGGADTGYQWTHAALQGRYRGWNGVSATHSYHWHDAIHSGGGSCGPNATQPCDDGSHGTHTLGIMLGVTATDNIGVAPGARWIGCRNMDGGNGTPSTYAECFQWFMAPTNSANQNPNPALAPHVISNSWVCTTGEGCNDVQVLRQLVETVRNAGIFVVAAAGNDGGSCASINKPPAIYAASFTVGASDNNNNIASFSSRGLVTVDGSNRQKPDVVAPGLSIYSTVPNGYGIQSGTSMAAPHVAGVVALLISADPSLAGDVTALEQLLRSTALARTTTEQCGGVPGTQIPNPTYGYGRVDALAAVQAALVRNLIFSDGFASGDASAWSVAVP